MMTIMPTKHNPTLSYSVMVVRMEFTAHNHKTAYKKWGRESFRSIVNFWRRPTICGKRFLYGIADCATFCSNFSCAALAQPCMTWK